jgi:hypothetical protein
VAGSDGDANAVEKTRRLQHSSEAPSNPTACQLSLRGVESWQSELRIGWIGAGPSVLAFSAIISARIQLRQSALLPTD